MGIVQKTSIILTFLVYWFRVVTRMDTPLFDGELVHARRMIYTPSAFAKSNLVHLQEVGQLQARSPHASTRQGRASYLFFVGESGSG